MHDPKTVAFDIRNPLSRRGGPLFTIWHVDPEKGGDVDSCGWSCVTLSKEDYDWVEETAKNEWSGWFAWQNASINLKTASELVVVAAAWAEVRHYVTGRHRRDPLSAWDISQVFGLMTSSVDNFGHLVGDARKSVSGLERLLAFTLRIYLTARRRPWQHPRWHFWHWQIQCHPIQRFCRWMWSRCVKCGGRFKWGYSPVSFGWGGGDGPRFFRGEVNVFHRDCAHPRR